MNHRAMGLFVMGSLALALAFVPQSTAQAKKCYDSSKNVIPCPQSNYMQTQQAKKANGPSATPVLPTQTPTATATYTLEPTATLTPAPTATPEPAASETPVAAIVIPSPPAGTVDSAACRTSPFGELLAGVGLLAAGIILRAGPRATDGSSEAFGYGHSQAQGRVIGTAFDETSHRANERLLNADPVSASGDETGARSRANGLVRASRLARLLSLPCIGVGGLQMVAAAGQYSGVLGCTRWPAPVADGGIAATGIGIGVAFASVMLASILRGIMRTSVKYTMFSPDGTPTRATGHVAMKQPSGASGKTQSDSSKDDDSDGDDS